MITKEEMQLDIETLIELGMFDKKDWYIEMYIQTYGVDDYILNTFMADKEIKLALVCINCSENYKNGLINQISSCKYIEVYIIDSDVSILEKTYKILNEMNAEYVCFLLENHIINNEFVYTMLKCLEENKIIDTAICYDRLITDEGLSITEIDNVKCDFLKKGNYQGNQLLEYMLKNGNSLSINLSSMVVRRQKFIETLVQYKGNVDEELKWLYFSCFIDKTVGGIDKILVDTIVKKFDAKKLIYRCGILKKTVNYLEKNTMVNISNDSLSELPTVYKKMSKQAVEINEIVNRECKKEITFFYTDKGEYYNLEPLGKEAEKRGYRIRFTQDIYEKAEIGIYCQHVCFPENSKVSMILLHDMAQGHNRWPDIWNVERWNKFDIGILPGKEWTKKWEMCASRFYANPRVGVFEAGYPKGDVINGKEFEYKVSALKEKLNLKYEYSLLYAPSWENDFKEDDFVNACQSLQVNLLIKQADWPDCYGFEKDNIALMRELHENKFDNVYYIEPEENIMAAIALCDVLISDESSVMTEALLLGKPSIAVTDWKIPDTNPPRFSEVPFDYVFKCEKKQLNLLVQNILEKIKSGEDLKLNMDFFANIGKASNCILDILDSVLDESKEKDSLNCEVLPLFMPEGIWNI